MNAEQISSLLTINNNFVTISSEFWIFINGYYYHFFSIGYKMRVWEDPIKTFGIKMDEMLMKKLIKHCQMTIS